MTALQRFRNDVSASKMRNLEKLRVEALNEVRFALFVKYNEEKREAYRNSTQIPHLGNARYLDDIVIEARKRGWECTDDYEAAINRIRFRGKNKSKAWYEDCCFVYTELLGFFKNLGGEA